MFIEKIQCPYEIMIRLNRDGTVGGCHRRDIEVVRNGDTGEVYSERELDPEPLMGADIDLVIGVANTALVQTLNERESNIVYLSNLVDAVNDSLAKAVDEKNVLRQRVAELEQLLEAANAGA